MIHVTGLNKTFSGVQALKHIDLHIKPGEMVALIGSSGSGKSTLMRHICGLTVSDRNSGEVTVNGYTSKYPPAKPGALGWLSLKAI